MSLEISDKEKNHLKNVLYKGQFRMKLGLKYKLLTGFSIGFALLVFMIPLEPIIKAWIFIGGFFVYSKWFFNHTRERGYFEPLAIKLWANLRRKNLENLRAKEFKRAK